MTFDERCMVGNDEKRICLFEHIRSKITTLAKCTITTTCFGIQGGMAPILHPGNSLVVNVAVLTQFQYSAVLIRLTSQHMQGCSSIFFFKQKTAYEITR